MPMKVSRIEVGMEMAVTSVERTDSRNSRMTMTAKNRPSVPSVASASIELSMNGAWSKTTVNAVPEPIAVARPGRVSCTSRDTSTVLPSGVLVTASVSEGSPLTRE